MKRCCHAVLASVLLLVAGASSGRACVPADPAAAPAFPLHVPQGKRHLEDAAGRPFFMNGDTPWSLIAELSREDAAFYLRDRKARGFNTILVNLIEHKFATKAPANIYGERPFLAHGDFGSVNEHYFAHADWVLGKACELGFLVLLAPAYLGFGGGGDGWYADMQQSGEEKLRAYGRFVGARYKGFDNIVWVHGGDHNPEDKDLVRAIAAGIREVDPGALHTAHGAPETAAMDYWAGEPWLSINNVYTYGPVHSHAHRQYSRSDALPFFLMESAYEFEHDADARRIRTQAYSAVLSGAFGHLYGNNPIWHFSGPGLFPPPMGWKEAQDSPGARSMSVLAGIFRSIAWWQLVPDMRGGFLGSPEGGETPPLAAIAADGSFALAYLPDGGAVTLDLARLSGEMFSARWRDPGDGSALPVAGAPLSSAPRRLKPPERNSVGDGDWILEVFRVGEKGDVR